MFGIQPIAQERATGHPLGNGSAQVIEHGGCDVQILNVDGDPAGMILAGKANEQFAEFGRPSETVVRDRNR